MNQIRTRSSILVFAFSGAVLGGCSDTSDEPCPGVVKGATYDIEIGQPTRVALPAGCYADWGLTADTLIVATVKKTYSSATCSVGTPELSGFPNLDLQIRNDEAPSDGFMQADYIAKSADCSAVISMTLDVGGGLPCFHSGSQTSSGCQLELDMYGETGSGCPARCSAYLATTVTKQ